MLATIKSKLEKTKKHVKKYETTIACAATAFATAYVVRKADIRIMRQFAYNAGYRAGESETLLIEAFTFITDKDLWKEFADLHGFNYGRN